MRKLTIGALGTALILTMIQSLTSCDDSSYTIGSSLVEDSVQVLIDSSFTVTGTSVRSERVQSRTTTQLIGRLDAEGYGMLSSEIVTQFMPGLVMDADSFTVEDIDSVRLTMHLTNGAFTGDSLTPMGIKVYPLTQQLPSPIYSDFDPTGYYDPNVCWGSTIYSATALGQSDSIFGLSTRQITVMLPRQFGVDLYTEYVNNPATFNTPSAFAQWFPGLYIANSFGNGRVTRIDRSYITLFYHYNSVSEDTGNDTTYYYANTLLAVSPEIVTDNAIRYNMSSALEQRVAAGEALVVAPIGYELAINFPAQEVYDWYTQNAGRLALLNGLTMEIPAEEIANDYGIEPPTYLLLVKKSKADDFFAKNQLTDGVNSFYATYSSTSKSYIFSDMVDYAQAMLDAGGVTDDDKEFLIIPVSLVTETSSSSSSSSYYYYYYYGTTSSTTTVTGIVPYVINPVMVRLKLDEAKIRCTLTKQSL